MSMKLVTTIDTFLKQSTADSSTLNRDDMAWVRARTEFPVAAYRQESGHIIFTIPPDQFDLRALHPSGRNTWHIFQGAIEDPQGFSQTNRPVDVDPVVPQNMGVQFTLPGNTSPSWSGQPVHATRSPNITWAEALHFNGTNYRRPVNASIVNNIILICEEAQKIRDMYGRPLRVHSLYRDPETNRRVGGASQSIHLSGGAIDFSIPGVSVLEIYNRLNPTWPGGLAYSTRMGFVHLDIRHRLSGGRARWVYPGG